MNTTAAEPGPDPIVTQPRAPGTATGAGVLVVDVGAWLGARLRELVETESGFWLAGLTDSTDDARSMAEHGRVDLAVIGHHPPSWSGLSLCRELKRSPSPPGVVICAARPGPVLGACCVVAEADALAGVYDCDAQLAGVLDRVARGIRFLPAVPRGVAALLHARLEPAERAMFSMLLAGLPGADVARGLRMDSAEFESRRSALLGTLQTFHPLNGNQN